MKIIKNARLNMLIAIALSILTIPLVAMQFSNQVRWKLSDFVVFGVLLLATAFFCELVLQKIKNRVERFVFCTVLLLLLLMVWAELAVGIIGRLFENH